MQAHHRLAGVQALRAIAAWGVVICHLGGFEQKYLAGPQITPVAFQYGMAGVDIYFVLSGFIITTMCLGRFQRRGEAGRFLKRRFLRIYPIYWLWCAAVLAVFSVDPHLVNSSHGRPDVLRSILLLPQRNLPLLLVSWTLVYEVFFYLLFAAALRWMREEHLPWALGVWGAVVATAAWMLKPTEAEPWLNLVASPLLLEFIMGGAVALCLPRIGCGASIAALGLGIAAFVLGSAVLLALHVPFPLGWERVLIYGTGAALLIAGLTGLEREGRCHLPRWMAHLGDSSYSLYLSHVPVMAVAGVALHRLLHMPSPGVHVAVLAAAFGAVLIGGLLSFRLLERPLLTLLRDRPARLAIPLPAPQLVLRAVRVRHDSS